MVKTGATLSQSTEQWGSTDRMVWTILKLIRNLRYNLKIFQCDIPNNCKCWWFWNMFAIRHSDNTRCHDTYSVSKIHFHQFCQLFKQGAHKELSVIHMLGPRTLCAAPLFLAFRFYVCVREYVCVFSSSSTIVVTDPANKVKGSVLRVFVLAGNFVFYPWFPPHTPPTDTWRPQSHT